MAYEIHQALCSCCHQCKAVCPAGAVRFKGAKYWIDPEKCIDCGACAKVCHNCIITKAGEASTPAPAHDPIRLEADLVVCGGGGSGLMAAAKAASLTGKKVLVLEKSKKCGGNTWYAGGFRVHYSKLLKEAGEPDTRDEQIRRFLIDVLWQEDRHLVYNVFQATEHLADWLMEECGCAEDFSVGETPFGGKGLMFHNKTGRKFKRLDTSIGPGGMGSYLVEKLLAKCAGLGVQILTEHAAQQLIVEDGRVAGVLAKDPSGITEVRAKAVVLSTGCFSHNPAYLEKATPGFFAEGEPVHRFSVPTCTGDGITMASAIGADIDWKNTKALTLGPAHHPFGFATVCICREPEVVLFNLDGKRWANEMENTMALRHEFKKQPKFVAYAVADSKIVQTCAERLIAQGRGGEDGVRILSNYLQEIEEESQLEMPTKKAATLEELAELMGVPADTFVAEIERYNEMCRQGRDTDFFKDPKYMLPVENPPYYAFFEKRFQENAAGGMKIDSTCHVLDTEGNVIPGLFGTGDNTRGILIGGDLGTDYVERIISALTWCVASGYIAGEAAAAEI